MTQLDNMGEHSATDTAPELKTTLPDNLPFKKRIARFDQYYDVRTFSTKLRKSAKPRKEREHKHAIIVRRLIDDRGRHRDTVVDIKSTRLCDVLVKINENVEGLSLSRREPEVTKEFMYYSYPGLLECLAVEEGKEERDEPLIGDIQAAKYFVEEYLGSTIEDVKEMTKKREISFDTAWALFYPNSLVYSRHTITDQDTILLVRRSGYERRQDGTDYLEVVCDIIHHDGEEFGFAKRILRIDKYPGTRPIPNLFVYPLQYHENYNGIYSRAVELGKRLLQLPVHYFCEIRGRASRQVDPRQTEPRFFGASRRVERGETEPFFVNGRVMISPLAYTQFHSTIYPAVYQALKKDSLTDDQYAICSPIVMGFAFDCKIWGEFSLTHSRDVDWNDGAFGALVLGQKQKTLIHSLVRQHTKKETNFDDIIKGKGQGLIGLLAGTPGCGKTLTAEAVAEVTHKPLYIISAGELGITPTSLESALVSVFQLAQMWDAVLLLDEAEVFLMRRDFSQLERNALVSIFLRRLEYYKGILFLTTNMLGSCDPAFESRIHFSINYPGLDADSRKIIWSTFFKRSSIDISDEELCRLASYPINGRQIKNSFSSALTITRERGSCPGGLLKDIDVVLSVLNDWNNETQSATHHGPANGDILI